MSENESSLTNRYPYLIYWKQRGLKRFPTIPPQELLNPHRERLKKIVKEKLCESPVNVFFPLPEELVDGIIEEHIPIMDGIVAARLQEIMHEEENRLGRIVIEARRKIIRGESRDKVVQELISQVLPNTQGGGSIFTKNQKTILRRIHKEMQNCIKEIRENLSVPLKSRSDTINRWGASYSWGTDESQSIIEESPKFLKIFDEKELPLLTKHPSIRQTSLEIISKRLKRCLPHKIAPRTLKDILSHI